MGHDLWPKYDKNLQGHQSMLKTSSDLNTPHSNKSVFKKSFSGGSYHRIAMSPCYLLQMGIFNFKNPHSFEGQAEGYIPNFMALEIIC